VASRDSLAVWEIALIKAFMSSTGMNDQEILPYFSRPGRSINHRVIAEIRTGSHFADVEAATEEDLRVFKERWFSYSVKRGVEREIEELVLKAREAQIAAIQIFNNPAIQFRAEIYIVLSIIAWTYAFHAFYKRRGVDYRYYIRSFDGRKSIDCTNEGLERYWDLGKCIEVAECPLSESVKENLRFIISVRNSIAHRFTGNIDLKIASKLQACALNFNAWIAEQFGGEYRIDSDFGVAIQMSSFSHDQAKLIYAAQEINPNILTIIDKLDDALPERILKDTKYAFNILFVEQSCNRPGQADRVVEFIRAGSETANEIDRVVFKDRERAKYKPAQIVAEMKRRGFAWFNMSKHTEIRRKLDAKNPKNGYGVELADNQWYYYDNWLEKVSEHCKAASE
jgi:Protein of unknown function (DUF3644)